MQNYFPPPLLIQKGSLHFDKTTAATSARSVTSNTSLRLDNRIQVANETLKFSPIFSHSHSATCASQSKIQLKLRRGVVLGRMLIVVAIHSEQGERINETNCRSYLLRLSLVQVAANLAWLMSTTLSLCLALFHSLSSYRSAVGLSLLSSVNYQLVLLLALVVSLHSPLATHLATHNSSGINRCVAVVAIATPKLNPKIIILLDH